MGYTASLTSPASQLEGNPDTTAASFTFNLTREAGDLTDGDNVSFRILDASTLAPSDDFAVNTGHLPTWSGGLTDSLTITANPDNTVEPDETFQVWMYRDADPSHPFYTGSVTLQNDDNGAPVFSSPAAVNVAENQTSVETATATGSGVVTYALSGADSALFHIDPTTHALTFLSAPNFEAPADADHDNVYQLTLTATADGLSTAQNLAVTVTNADDIAPTITSANAVHVLENTQTVQTETATTDLGTGVTWSIVSGGDGSAFTIDPNSGALAFASKPDHENPTDADHDNVYQLTVQATDAGGLHSTQALNITVDNVVEPSVITSNGGATDVLIHVPENTTSAVTTIVATNDEFGVHPTYGIAAGADGGDFNIDPTTGVLTFASSPNYEAPVDSNHDNVYQVNVTAGTGDGTATQSLFVFVDNVVEPGETPPDAGGGGGGSGGGVDNTPHTTIGTDNGEYLLAGTGGDTINGEGGNDAIDGNTGSDFIEGGDGNDIIRGMDGADTVDGGSGDDDVNGNTGNDIVSGGDGNDTVRGGQDNDTVDGNAGDDPHVNGNKGDDVVHGDIGNDTVYGGQGNDTVYGDDGNDLVSGDLGNDILYGGSGADGFAFAKGGGQDWVADFNAAEGDHIVLPTGTAYTVTSFQGQVMIDLGGGDTIGLAGVPIASFSTDWITFS